MQPEVECLFKTYKQLKKELKKVSSHSSTRKGASCFQVGAHNWSAGLRLSAHMHEFRFLVFSQLLPLHTLMPAASQVCRRGPSSRSHRWVQFCWGIGWKALQPGACC